MKSKKAVKENSSIVKDNSTASNKTNFIKKLIRVLINIIVTAICVYAIYLMATGVVYMVLCDYYEDTYEMLGEIPEYYPSSDVDLENIDNAELQSLLFEDADYDFDAELKEAAGDNIDASGLVNIAQYVKDRYAEDKYVMTDTKGNAFVSNTYIISKARIYMYEVDEILGLVKGKDAINDLYSKVVGTETYNPTVAAIKNIATLEFRDEIDRIVTDDALKVELKELCDKLYRIVVYTYNDVYEMTALNTDIENIELDIIGDYKATFSFENMSDNQMLALWLGSADSISYSGYKFYYETETNEDRDARATEVAEKFDKYDSILSKMLKFVPFIGEDEVATGLLNKGKEYIRIYGENFTENESKYINEKYGADYWAWRFIADANDMSNDSMVLVTDTDRVCDYYIQLTSNVEGNESTVLRDCWTYAQKLVFSYIAYGAGALNESTADAFVGVLGNVDDALAESYMALFNAEINKGSVTLYPFKFSDAVE